MAPLEENVLPLVSVIVPTKDSSMTLEACLASIRAQTYSNLELIVVDNHSTDDTRAIAERLADRVLLAGPERSPQTNLGAKMASGEWIYQVGSDFLIEPTVVEEAVAACLEKALDAVLIHNRSDPRASLWARARAFEREMYRGDTVNVAARFIRRELFLELGGFDETLVAAEDYDLHARLVQAGAKIDWIKATELHIGEPRSASEVFRKHFFYGKVLRKYVRKRGYSTFAQLSPVRPAFLRNLSQFAGHPVDASLFVAYQTLKYFAGALGFIVGNDTPGKSGGPTSIVVSPATEFGSWRWIEEVIEHAPPEVTWYVVSYGTPHRALPNVVARCLPRTDYLRIGFHLSKRRFLFANAFYFLPLAPMAAWTAVRRRPDLLVANGIASLAVLLPLKVLGGRAYLMFHGYTEYMGKRWDSLLRVMLRMCDGAFVNSETSRLDLERLLDPAKIVVVEHWAEQTFFDISLVREDHERLRVLFVGRLDAEKFAQCLRVARVLSAEGSIELWTVGRGSLENEARKLPQARTLGYVHDRDLLARIYGSADVVWAPADTTYLSRPGVEAMAAGCPVVVSQTPSVAVRAQEGKQVPRDLIPEEVGWVVDGTHDEEALVLLRSLATEGVPLKFRESARRYALERHSIANIELIVRKLFVGYYSSAADAP